MSKTRCYEGELSPEVVRAFVRDMQTYCAAKDSLKRHEIAAKQLWLLKQHWNGKLRVVDVIELLEQMRVTDPVTGKSGFPSKKVPE